MKQLVRKTGLVTAALVALTSGGAVLGVDAASAASTDTLTVTPSTGDQDTFSSFTVSNACPSPYTGVQVNVTGPGMPVGGDLIVGNTTPSALQNSGRTASAALSWKDFFSNNGVTPSGTYSVNWECRNGGTTTKTITGAVNFTSTGGVGNGTYVAAIPTTTTLAAIATPVGYGTASTLQATVSPADANGTVQFKDGAANLGSAQPIDASGVATLSQTLSAGSHTITASFVPTAGAAHTASTSDPQTVQVDQAGVTATISANPAGSQTQFSAVTFTATLSQSAAGTVGFLSDGSTIPSCGSQVVSGSTATCSTAGLGQGTHLISVVFTPTDTTNYSSYSTPAGQELSYQITPPSAFSQDYEDISATVAPGSLVLSVASRAVVDLGQAAINSAGDLFTATGTLNPVTITDTRAGDTGWTSSGVLTGLPTQPAGANGDFIGTNDPTHRVNKFNLGWTPKVYVVSGVPQIASHQAGLHVGSAVVPATEQGGGTTPADATLGLGSARPFAAADAGKGTGTVKLVADLLLNIPTATAPDTYTSRLTFTVTG